MLTAFTRRAAIALAVVIGTFGAARAQYCVPTYTYSCTSDDDINDFTLTGAFSTSISDLGTGCSTNNYDNRIGIVAPVTVQQGGTYAGTITTDYFSDENVRIWIDYDSNQVFDPSEEVSNFGPFGSGAAVPFQINIPFSAPANVTRRMRVRLVYNTLSSIIDPCTNENYGETHDYAVFIAATPPCSGTPTAGTVSPAGPITSCAGNSFALTTTGTTFASGLVYQWQQSVGCSGVWTNVLGGTGGNTLFYTTPQLFTTTCYRLQVSCGTSTATTASVTFNITGPTYATLPYTQGFESWQSFCNVNDVPSNNWLNSPATGDSSWRRDDQGASANWSYPPGGAYTPASAVGSHSARFHSYATWMGRGTLDLFVNASAAGPKELQFYMINPTYFFGDSLNVYLSTDGGTTFSQIGGYDTASAWSFRSIPFTSTSAQTVLRFEGVSDYSDDIGIDEVKVLTACAGAPTAGVIPPMTPCPNQNFILTLTGSTQSAGLTYQFQQSSDGITWTNVPGATSLVSTGNIPTATYFRAIVTCTVSGLSDTSAAVLYNVGTFYYCYCSSSAQYNTDEDVGNVNIKQVTTGTTIFNNGTATPTLNNATAVNTYTNFTNIPAPTLLKDSLYRYTVAQITDNSFFYQSFAAIWIDYNHNGIFDAWERVMLKPTSSTTYIATDTFRIPDSAQVGITGMRVILTEGTFQAPTPCGQYYAGETEDYLVNIAYPPCSGTPSAGITHISDTITCPGLPLTLTDTTHTIHFTGLATVWQQSTDGITFTDIAGSNNKDTLQFVASGTDLYYRFNIDCNITGTSAQSNVVHVHLKFPYQCYCQSFATGGATDDITDVGAFAIGNFVTNSGGAHLNNATAIRAYTDYTQSGQATLYTDSTYAISAYQVMRGAQHADAKLTLFIDYNNNNQYDIPSELVWTGYTNSSDYYLVSSIHTPVNAVTGVLTGMRLIINNDVGPNIPSDEACGTYLSGETEDYVLRMKSKNGTGINHVGNNLDAALYPNPTNGRVTLQLDASKAFEKVRLVISNVTGQEVGVKQYTVGSKEFNTVLDLSALPKGVYLVRIEAGDAVVMRKVVLQ